MNVWYRLAGAGYASACFMVKDGRIPRQTADNSLLQPCLVLETTGPRRPLKFAGFAILGKGSAI